MNEFFRILPALLKEFEDNLDVREVVIFAAWRKIAGEMLREQAVPVELNKNRLVVAVGGKMWKDHLEALSGQMIFKLNSSLGSAAVTFIEFRVDEKTVEAERAKSRASKMDPEESARLALGEITPKLRDSARAIKDEDMREQFLLAAGRCLARKKILAERDQ
jgi:hypothetical protein